MSNTVKILFLGATGYAGGTVLDGLLKHPKAAQFDITAFFRSAEKAKNYESIIGLNATSGDLSALENAVAGSDVVFNLASSDDLSLAQAVLAGAKTHYVNTSVPPVLIHISGSAVIAENAMGQHASEKVYDDSDTATLDALPMEAIHRNVDVPIANAHKEGYVKAYVVAPPFIWGLATGKLVDAGLQNPVTSGLLAVSRLAIARGSVGQVGPGLNLWSAVEVNDLAKLFLTIFNVTVIDNKDIAGGNTYYFAAEGDVAAKDWMTKLAQSLHKHGALKSAEVTPITQDEMTKWPILIAYAMNSRVSDSRARSLGWKPVHHATEFFDEIDKEVALLVTQKKGFGASWAVFE